MHAMHVLIFYMYMHVRRWGSRSARLPGYMVGRVGGMYPRRRKKKNWGGGGLTKAARHVFFGL